MANHKAISTTVIKQFNVAVEKIGVVVFLFWGAFLPIAVGHAAKGTVSLWPRHCGGSCGFGMLGLQCSSVESAGILLSVAKDGAPPLRGAVVSGSFGIVLGARLGHLRHGAALWCLSSLFSPRLRAWGVLMESPRKAGQPIAPWSSRAENLWNRA